MPKRKETKQLCVDTLRYNEYYGMQQIYDDLYARSKRGEQFTNLMSTILRRENILLAYRNIKTNKGSNNPGVDQVTIQQIERLTPEEVVDRVTYYLTGSKHGYRPKPVKRKELRKPNGESRPLGVPCMWDRLIQQCIKQVMEPICEAKFSEHSYGFRPNRSAEQAIAEVYQRIQRGHLHYVIELDIKDFFDSVDHQKLLRQVWSLGIRDEVLKSKLKRILNTPVKLQDGTLFYPKKGIPQGGTLSPLLANIVLNELDHWVESNWEWNPITQKYAHRVRFNRVEDHSAGYVAMRKTRLKEMYIVRYADDFRILCRSKNDAERAKTAIVQWIADRLKLEVSAEKTRIINVKKKYMLFLGFKIKVHKKGNKEVVKSHVSNRQLRRIHKELAYQAARIARPNQRNGELREISMYNTKVMGIQQYYDVATEVSQDFHRVNRSLMIVFTNRLKSRRGNRLLRSGRKLSKAEQEKYGKSKMLRYVAGTKEPIYPIGFVKHRKPMNKKRSVCSYTQEGRRAIHSDTSVNTGLLWKLMQQPLHGRSIEYVDNRIALFSVQHGKCAVTGYEFISTDEIHCHHIVPKEQGGTDQYSNLVLVYDKVHKLIHAKADETVNMYRSLCKLDAKQIAKLNKLRQLAGNDRIA